MSAGTITLTNGSAIVGGSETSFATELAAGDFIVSIATVHDQADAIIHQSTATIIPRIDGKSGVTVNPWLDCNWARNFPTRFLIDSI
ncbi:TPA: hypothetical protein ACY3IJ_002456 [Enterobacter asburiae]